MKRHSPRPIALLLALALQAPFCLAGKPAAKDPMRQALIQAIRGHAALQGTLLGQRMDIRLFRVEGDLAYVCMLLVDAQGRHHQQDGMLTVLQLVLKRQAGAAQATSSASSTGTPSADKMEDAMDKGWTPVAKVDGLADNARDVQCLGDERGAVTRAFLEGLAANPALGLR